MLRKFAVFACALMGLAVGAVVQGPSDSTVSSDAEIRKILAQRVYSRQSVGIVVAVIEPKGRRVVAYGNLDKGDPRPLNGDTPFEIGSITKVFTSLLLSDMAEHGEVALTDPVQKYLPKETKITSLRGPGADRVGQRWTSASAIPLKVHRSAGLHSAPESATLWPDNTMDKNNDVASSPIHERPYPLSPRLMPATRHLPLATTFLISVSGFIGVHPRFQCSHLPLAARRLCCNAKWRGATQKTVYPNRNSTIRTSRNVLKTKEGGLP